FTHVRATLCTGVPTCRRSGKRATFNLVASGALMATTRLINFQRVQSVFQAVAELPSAERAMVLERECGGDADLRRQVEALLKAHGDPGELPAAEPQPTGAYVPAVKAGQVFAGRYKLREKLGEGGMGV